MEKKTLTIVTIVVAVLLVLFVAEITVYGIKDWFKGKKPSGGKPASECNDHLDNDGDGYCDFAWKKAKCDDGSIVGDAGCSSKDDNDETNCGDGICEGPEACDVCVADCGTCGPADSCDDSDWGFVPEIKGTVSGYSDGSPYSYTDSCNVDGTILLEWYCSGTQPVSYPWECSGNFTSCSNRACV